MIPIKTLTRGQVAASAGLDIETVRFYEKQGLIDDPPRSESGYRQYAPEDVSRLRFIRRAKELGFSLKEIAELLSLQEAEDVNRADIRALAEAKLDDISKKIRDLASMKEALSQLTHSCQGKGALETCPIMEALSS